MDISTIGLDLAKSVFQVHGVDASGAVVIRKVLRRSQVLPFFAKLSPCRRDNAATRRRTAAASPGSAVAAAQPRLPHQPRELETPTSPDRRRLPKHPPSCPPLHTHQQKCPPGGAPSTTSIADAGRGGSHSQRRAFRQYAKYCSPNSSRAFASSIGMTTAFITSTGMGSNTRDQRLPRMIATPA